MIIVTGEISVEAGAIERVRDALARMEHATREEPGCLTYAFSVDINDPTTVRVFERWESIEALQAHFVAPHMAEFAAAVGQVQPRSITVNAYEVAREVALPGSS